jgi:mRNA interferase RelE/StbE
LTGRFGARVRPYRIVYRVDEGARTVIVERIEHRADVYRQR